MRARNHFHHFEDHERPHRKSTTESHASRSRSRRDIRTSIEDGTTTTHATGCCAGAGGASRGIMATRCRRKKHGRKRERTRSCKKSETGSVGEENVLVVAILRIPRIFFPSTAPRTGSSPSVLHRPLFRGDLNPTQHRHMMSRRYCLLNPDPHTNPTTIKISNCGHGIIFIILRTTNGRKEVEMGKKINNRGPPFSFSAIANPEQKVQDIPLRFKPNATSPTT